MKSLKIFLSGASEDKNKLIPKINSTGHRVIGISLDSSESLRQIKNLQPDLVLVDISSNGEDFFKVARIVAEDNIPIILLIDYAQKDRIIKVAEKNFFTYLIKPVSEEVLLLLLEVSVNYSNHVQSLEGEIKKLKKELVSRKVIEKAKGILMENQGISENEAFRRIQKQSMNKRISMKKMSEAIIMAYEIDRSS